MKRIVVFALVLNAALLGVIAHQLVAIAGGGAVATQNGDTNGDGSRDISDAVHLLQWLFSGGEPPVAIAQEGGNDDAIEELREQIAELQSGSRLSNAAIVNNMDAIAGLRADVDSVMVDTAGNVAAIADLVANPAGGLNAVHYEMLEHMSIEQLPTDDDGNTAKTIRFSGVNVQVVNGTGSTNGDGNGLGNLIVGYQELRTDDPWDNGIPDDTNDRSGSHNLVVGSRHNYSIFAGMVVGGSNTISGPWSTVSGGENNIASGFSSTVSGGEHNTASGLRSTVSGGYQNTASARSSTVSGGSQNTASEDFSTVGGGCRNSALAEHSTVSGGDRNTAERNWSTVSGGLNNTASGSRSTVSGGGDNTALGQWSTVSGGRSNSAGGIYSHVRGHLTRVEADCSMGSGCQ